MVADHQSRAYPGGMRVGAGRQRLACPESPQLRMRPQNARPLRLRANCRTHSMELRTAFNSTCSSQMGPEIATVTLWRPVRPKELDLIRQSGMRAFPPRVPEEPIFYPVLSEAYAATIARDWNVPASGKGYVTHFLIADKFLDRYQLREAG